MYELLLFYIHAINYMCLSDLYKKIHQGYKQLKKILNLINKHFPIYRLLGESYI